MWRTVTKRMKPRLITITYTWRVVSVKRVRHTGQAAGAAAAAAAGHRARRLGGRRGRPAGRAAPVAARLPLHRLRLESRVQTQPLGAPAPAAPRVQGGFCRAPLCASDRATGPGSPGARWPGRVLLLYSPHRLDLEAGGVVGVKVDHALLQAAAARARRARCGWGRGSRGPARQQRQGAARSATNACSAFGFDLYVLP